MCMCEGKCVCVCVRVCVCVYAWVLCMCVCLFIISNILDALNRYRGFDAWSRCNERNYKIYFCYRFNIL